MKIYRRILYLPDEILESWLYRLANANCLDVEDFLDSYFDSDIYKDLLGNLVKIGYRDAVKALYDTTVFAYESFVTRTEHQSRLMFHWSGRKELGEPRLQTEFRVCPVCVEEDTQYYGFAYIHKSHCLNGVYDCFKHGVKLSTIAKTGQKSLCFEIDDKTVHIKSSQAEWELAKFAVALADCKSCISLQDLREIIRSRVQELYGESATWNDIPFEEYRYYDLLVPEDKQKLRLKLRSFRNLNMRYMIVVLACLFDCDIDSFRKYAEKCSCGSNPGIGRYVCRQCGKAYYQNKWGSDNIGCPYCAVKNEDRLLRNIIDKAGDSEYEPVGDMPLSVNHRTDFMHSCGRKLILRPTSLIFDGSRCKCKQYVSFEEAAKRVKSVGDYELVKYNGTEAKVIIRANECAHSFSVLLHKFVQSPYCRVCEENRKMDGEKFIARVKELTSGDFDVLGEFRGADKRINIRHNLCGKEHSYLPYLFLKNCRCAECAKNISLARLNGLLIDMYQCRYLVIKKDGKYILRDSVENADTPCRISEVYSRLCGGKYIARNRSEELYNYLRRRYKKTDFFESRLLVDIADDYKQLLSKLKKSGKIKSVMLGLYTFAENNYTADDVVKFLYIERYGRQIGYIIGNDTGSVIDIATTMKKSERVTKKDVLGLTVRLHKAEIAEM